MRKMLVADLLCGAGGSSTGCARPLADLSERERAANPPVFVPPQRPPYAGWDRTEDRS